MFAKSIGRSVRLGLGPVEIVGCEKVRILLRHGNNIVFIHFSEDTYCDADGVCGACVVLLGGGEKSGMSLDLPLYLHGVITVY